MSGKVALAGPGCYQWKNLIWWFASQLSGTLWLFVMGLMWLIKGAFWVGVGGMVLALVPNIASLRLWLSRDRIRPYPALQILMGSIWFFVMGGILVFARAEGIPIGRIPLLMWIGTLVFPFWMLFFHFRESHAVKSRKSGDAKGESGPR